MYAVVGSATPERALFRGPADPLLTLGVRLSPQVDVQAGVRVGTTTRSLVPGRIWRGDLPVEPGDLLRFEQHTRTSALAVGAGLTERLGPVEVRSRASVSLDVLDRASTTERYALDEADPAGGAFVRSVEEASATFAHSGLSAVVAVPIQRRTGRMAPGVGLAVAASSRLRGTVGAPPLQTMAFLGVPTTVAVGPTRVTLDATLGVARGAQSSTYGGDGWGPVVEAGLRVDL